MGRNMENKMKNLKEIVYFLEEVNNSTEIEEQIKNYICKEKATKNALNGEYEKELLKLTVMIDLGKIKFVVYSAKNREFKEKIMRFKTSGEILYEDRLSENKNFETDLCFAILHSKENRFNFIFEELVEEITNRIDEYKNL